MRCWKNAIDNAETANAPVSAKKTLIIAANLLLGLVVSVSLVLLKALLHYSIITASKNSIENPK